MISGWRVASLLASALVASTSAAAQDQTPLSRTGALGGGEVGQRQERDAADTPVASLERINDRIANRVQNRIRNRIDRNYDPQANATSPFEVAGEEATVAKARPR